MSSPYAGEQPQQPGHRPRPQQPWQPPFQPHADRWFGSVRGLGTAASVLIGLAALGQALFAASDWYTYRAVKHHVEGPVQDPDRLDRADLIAGSAAAVF